MKKCECKYPWSVFDGKCVNCCKPRNFLEWMGAEDSSDKLERDKNNYMSKNTDDDERLTEALKTLNKKSPTSQYMKQLNITLQEAKELWKEYKLIKERDLTAFEAVCLRHISRTWAAEELEEKEGYTWEESFSSEGWAITEEGINLEKDVLSTWRGAKSIFKTKEQAESALAYAQLTHIVAKSNEKETDDGKVYFIYRTTDNELIVGDTRMFKHLGFYSATSAMNSLKINRELWEKYWMVSSREKNSNL